MKGKDRDYKPSPGEYSRFFLIQISRYLELKPSRRFSGPGEYDAVSDMIKNLWVEILFNGMASGLNRLELDDFYHNVLMVFPDFVADAGGCYTVFNFIGPRTFVPDCLSFDMTRGEKGQTDTEKNQNSDTESI